MLKRYLARLPLTDRITFWYDNLGGMCYGVFNGLALPLIPIVARRIGMSATGIAAMISMQFVGALFGLFFGHLADRYRKMPFVVWPGAISRALLGLLFFAGDPASFFVISSLFFLIANLGVPAYASIMRSNYSDANRGKLMGDIRVIMMAISAACSTLAALALKADMSVLRWLFPAAAVFGVASAFIFGKVKVRRLPAAPKNPERRSFLKSLRIVGGDVTFLLFMAIFFLCTTPDKFAIPLEPLRLVDELHMTYEQASFLLGTVVSGLGIIGYFFWGRMIKRSNPFLLLAVIVLLTASRYAVLALARNVYDLIPMSVILGLINAGWDLVPLFCILPLVTDHMHFSLYFGVHWTLLGIRGIAGPLFGAFIYDTGAFSLPTLFMAIAGLTALGGLLLFPFARWKRKEST